MGLPYLGKPPRHRCGDPGDDIAYSLTLDNNQHATRAVAAGNAQRWTLSLWVRRAALTNVWQPIFGGATGYYDFLAFYNDKLCFRQGQEGTNFETAGLFRDVGGWMHIVLRLDTTNATAAQRLRLTVNGEDVALSGYPAQGWSSKIGPAGTLRLGGISDWGWATLSVADVIYVNDALIDPTAFGYINRDGVWVPRRYAGGYGAVGLHLDFADPLNLGKDASGLGNHFTVSGLTAASQSTDTPTHGYPVLSANDRYYASVSNGGRTMTANGGSGGCEMVTATTPIPRTGKWVLGEVVADTTNTSMCAGVRRGGARSRQSASGSLGITGYAPGECGYAFQGSICKDGATVQSGLPTTAAGAALMVLYDADAGLLTFRNAAGQIGAAVAYAWTPGLVFAVSKTNTYGGGTINFGDRAFTLAVPDGYKAMGTNNLPCPPIKRPARYVTTRLRTAGAGVDDLPWDPTAIPTAVLSKSRTNATDWRLNLSIRPGRAIAPNVAGVGDFAEADGLTFTTLGWTVGGAAAYAGNRIDYAWRASRAAGFDVLVVDHTTGTATTVPHAVGGSVDYAWVINLTTGAIKRVYHRLGLGSAKYLNFYEHYSVGTDEGWFASTAIDLTLGSGLPTGSYAVLPWRTVPQFSWFGTHIGNSSTDGPVLGMGFLPLLWINKNSTPPSGEYHVIQDIVRGTINPVDNRLYLNEALAESAPDTGGTSDVVSNGIKIRTTHFGLNGAGNIILGAAWAAVPGKFARAR